jgi:hypothetical protein
MQATATVTRAGTENFRFDSRRPPTPDLRESGTRPTTGALAAGPTPDSRSANIARLSVTRRLSGLCRGRESSRPRAAALSGLGLSLSEWAGSGLRRTRTMSIAACTGAEAPPAGLARWQAPSELQQAAHDAASHRGSARPRRHRRLGLPEARPPGGAGPGASEPQWLLRRATPSRAGPHSRNLKAPGGRLTALGGASALSLAGPSRGCAAAG